MKLILLDAPVCDIESLNFRCILTTYLAYLFKKSDSSSLKGSFDTFEFYQQSDLRRSKLIISQKPLFVLFMPKFLTFSARIFFLNSRRFQQFSIRTFTINFFSCNLHFNPLNVRSGPILRVILNIKTPLAPPSPSSNTKLVDIIIFPSGAVREK
jgi:hypothetical protein